MGQEARFWQQLKRRLEKIDRKKIHFERIESLFGTGFPDVLICYYGKYILLELKVHPNKLSANQILWHKNHTVAGGNVWTITKYKTRIECANSKGHLLPVSLGNIEELLKEITKENK